MSMDLKKFKEDYDNYPFEDKMKAVIGLLEPLKGKGSNFEIVYNLLATDPQLVTETDLDEIFTTILIGMHQDGQDKLKITEVQLNAIKDKLIQMKEKEKIEKLQENPEGYLHSAFGGI